MHRMIRKQIYIEPRQEAVLKSLSKARGITEAEVIRSAIEKEARSSSAEAFRPDLEAWEAIHSCIRSRIAKAPFPGKKAWKREDLYD